MNFLFINLNGVAAANKGYWMRNLKRKLKVDVIGLQETRQMGLSDIDLRRFWDSSSMQSCVVDSVGRSGGLALMWNPTVFSDASTLKNQRFLLVSSKIRGIEGSLNMINLHAPNDASQRRLFWNKIAELISQRSGLWILFSDFNDVREENEHVNSRFDRGAIDAFNEFINTAGLLEYPLTGGKFTYVLGHADVKMSKLDRFLVNDEFLTSGRWLKWKSRTEVPLIIV
ncbi:uncharacterized protein LOC110900166 [Helianthus annuus]|uniref:uncharacterized protein LOC110900166 n=1 Tax=Helianthus annuus TaxID=4232 RepID=UPI000B902FF1|nr:uncharacterized protein LOC110900166 [Helianthus annuus]